MNNSECQSYASQSEKEIEPALKDLLEKILLYLEKFIETKEDLQQVESELRDYENLVNLVSIIKTVFNTLANKIDLKFIKLNNQIDCDAGSHRSIRSEEEYEKLEQIIQKYEAEIRNHIRIEQQLKLYAESVQSKLEDSEKTRCDLLDSTKGMMNNIKRDNQKLSEINRQYKEETDMLRKINEQFERKYKLLEDETSQIKQKYSKYSSNVKKYDKRYDNKHGPSFSEHKLIPYHNESIVDPSTDYPQHSQISMKLNYLNHSPQKINDTQTRQTRANSKTQNIYGDQEVQSLWNANPQKQKQFDSQHKRYHERYTERQKKVNQNIQHIFSSISGVGSKNVSLNNSSTAQKYQHDAFMSQQRSRSQQGNTQSKMLMKQRTEAAAKVTESINKLWKFK